MDLRACAQTTSNCQRVVDDFLLSRGPLKALHDVSDALMQTSRIMAEELNAQAKEREGNVVTLPHLTPPSA